MRPRYGDASSRFMIKIIKIIKARGNCRGRKIPAAPPTKRT